MLTKKYDVPAVELNGFGSLELVDLRLEAVKVGAADHVDLVAALEELEGGHGLDAAVLGDLASLIDVNLHEDGVRDLGRELLELGLDHLTRGAPGGGEVDDDKLVLLQELGPLSHSFDFSDHLNN